MRIVHLKKLNDFGQRHAHTRKHLARLKIVIEKAEWEKKQDVLADFPKAKIIQDNRARLEILHNTFRVIIQINYEEKTVEIRFIGTHNEYDSNDPATI